MTTLLSPSIKGAGSAFSASHQRSDAARYQSSWNSRARALPESGRFAEGAPRRIKEAAQLLDNASGYNVRRRAVELTAEASAAGVTSSDIYVIASLDPDVLSGKKDVRQRAAELTQSLEQRPAETPPVAAEAAAASVEQGQATLSQRMAVSASQALSVYFSSDGLNSEIYASASAAVAAYYSAEVALPDGSRVSVEAAVEVSVSVELSVRQNAAGPAQQADPLALDLDGDGMIALSGVEDGAMFDLDADGRLDRSAFVSGDDAFLALDRDQNGRIDGGQELFGDQRGAANGFLELGKLDENGDGTIDARDSAFVLLGAVSRGEDGSLNYAPLSALGIAGISLAYSAVDIAASGGNRITQIGSYTTASGERRLAADVMLNYDPVTVKA